MSKDNASTDITVHRVMKHRQTHPPVVGLVVLVEDIGQEGMRVLPKLLLCIGVMSFYRCQPVASLSTISDAARLTALAQLDDSDRDNLVPVLDQFGHEPIQCIFARFVG
jgi:hypothetical protein